MSGAKVHQRRRGEQWTYDHWQRLPDNCIRHRLHHVISDRSPWWAWGNRVMALTGRDFGWDYQEPRPTTWWYRLGPPKRMAFTGFPRHPLSTFQIVTEYDEFKALTEGLNEDQMYEWKAICVDQDGELQLGHRYWGGNFYGLNGCEVALLRRYLRAWRRLDWYGLRSWLYLQGLHRAVHQKKPLSCKQIPAKGSGGYNHWYCELRKRHAGPHKFRVDAVDRRRTEWATRHHTRRQDKPIRNDDTMRVFERVSWGPGYQRTQDPEGER